jgi:hypothetical protein
LRGGGEREGEEWVVGGLGAGGEMTQALHAHMNNKTIKKITIKKKSHENNKTLSGFPILYIS